MTVSADELEELKEHARRLIAQSDLSIPLLDIRTNWDTIYIQLLEWKPHGVTAPTSHQIDYGYQDTPYEAVKNMITQKLNRAFKTQRKLIEQYGQPREIAPGEINLDIVSIDLPLRTYLIEHYRDDYEAFIRSYLAATSILKRDRLITDLNFKTYKKPISDFTIEIKRSAIMGQMTINSGDDIITWSKGSVCVLNDIASPESSRIRLRGKNLYDLVPHPLFEGDMPVTSCTAMRRHGREGIALVVKNHQVPVLPEKPEE